LGEKGTYVHKLVIIVDFLDTFHEFPADEFVAVPGRDDGFEVLLRNDELVGEMPGRPFDREKQVL